MKATDFEEGDGWCLELARSTDPRQLLFALYQGEGRELEFVRSFTWQGETFVPPWQDEILRHVRFPEYFSREFLPVDHLLKMIDSLLTSCLDLEEEYRFLLACFVMSTWVIDRLPIAPYVALVGPPGSGKTAALKVLHLLCRRGLLTSDISSAAFYRACDRVTPTLFIDETATAGQRRTLFHLLRSGTTRDVVALRENQSYRTFGAKVVAWPELPNDEALNSRCIIIPMHETSRTDLLRPDSPEIIKTAQPFMARLVRYRLATRGAPRMYSSLGLTGLRPRVRDLYESLALGIGEDPRVCARLLECLEHQQNINHEPLPANQSAVIGALYKQIHLHPEQTTYLNFELTKEANLILAASGEHFRMNWKAVGSVLKTYVFLKKRTKKGWAIPLDRAARKRIHELMSRYGVDVPSICLPSQELEKACEFCKAQRLEHFEASESAESVGYPPTTNSVGIPLEGRRNGEKEEEIEDIEYRKVGDVESSIAVEDIGVSEDDEAIEEEEEIENGEENEDIEEEDIDKYDQD